MAKKATKTETTPATPEVICSPLVDGKITASASIEFKHPFDQNTVYRPSVTLEYALCVERPIDEAGNVLTNDQIMDDLIGQADSAVERSKGKILKRLSIEEQLFEGRARMDTLRRQAERPAVSEANKAAYSSELKDLEKREQELLQELETLTTN